MRADEALKESKDGFIYLGAKPAYLIQEALHWKRTNPKTVDVPLTLTAVLSDDWQPSKPVELCEACKEAGKLKEAATTDDSLMAVHLHKYHCTCQKKEEL